MRRYLRVSGLLNRRTLLRGWDSALVTPVKRGLVAWPIGQDHGGGSGRAEDDLSDRQAEDRAHVQLELALILRDHGDHAGVVRARADLAEDDVVADDEQLDAEQAGAAEGADHGGGDLLGAREGLRRHRVRLPRPHVIAALLPVADRRAEQGALVTGADRQQRDLVVERDEALDDDASRAAAGAPDSAYSQAVATSAAVRTVLWPLPELDMTGLITQGRPRRCDGRPRPPRGCRRRRRGWSAVRAARRRGGGCPRDPW